VPFGTDDAPEVREATRLAAEATVEREDAPRFSDADEPADAAGFPWPQMVKMLREVREGGVVTLSVGNRRDLGETAAQRLVVEETLAKFGAKIGFSKEAPAAVVAGRRVDATQATASARRAAKRALMEALDGGLGK
jgi:hypothetical protein